MSSVNVKGLPEHFNFEGLIEEVLECSFDIADEKQFRLKHHANSSSRSSTLE